MQIIESPNEWLEKEVKPFDFEEYDAEKLSSEMIETMIKNLGIGLSANQVGIDGRIFVMRLFSNKEVKKPITVINPVIHGISEETYIEKEGCLSHSGLILSVERPVEVIAQFLDEKGKDCIMKFQGIDARCFMHEYEHLQGIEFTEKTSKLKLDLAKKKQKKLIKRMQRNG